MIRSMFAAVVLGAGMLAPALAQTPAPQAAPSAPQTATAPAGAGYLNRIQGANIFEVKPDADKMPGYLEQTNAERRVVQPMNNAPFWRQVNSGEPGYSSLPHSQAPEAGVLIQKHVQYPGSRLTTAGQAWREVRNNWLIPYGGSLMVIVFVAIMLFYFAKGSIKMHGAPTGRRIERFTYVERASHWVNAIAFCILAISGIVMAFGKFFMLPVMGGDLYGPMTWLLKSIHNFVGPLFAVSLVVMAIAFIRDNWPRRIDLLWLKKGGGLLTGEHVPSHRFNAGEKLMFWGAVIVLGGIVVASGLFLDKLVPGFTFTRGEMQIAHMIHAVGTILMMCMIMGHIYLGTLGMQGAYKAMKTGYVDETWAKEHHELWYDDIKAGKIPADRTEAARAAKRSGRPARA